MLDVDLERTLMDVTPKQTGHISCKRFSSIFPELLFSWLKLPYLPKRILSRDSNFNNAL